MGALNDQETKALVGEGQKHPGWARMARGEMLWVSLLYIAAGILVSWPLSLQIGREIPVGGDSWQNVWNLWWTQKALARPEWDLLRCPLIFHPQGLSLALHSNSYFNTILALPLQRVLSIETLHHLLIWIYFPASALAAYVLARRWVTSPLAAFMAGWVYAFSPFRIGRYIIEQVDVLSTALIPLFILVLLEFLDRQKWRAVLWAVAFLVLALLSSWYNGAFCYLFGIFAILYYWFEGRLGSRSRAFWAGLAALFLVPVLLLAPFIVPMIRDLSNPLFAQQVDQLEICRATSSDLLAFVTPGIQYPTFLEQSFGWHGPMPPRMADWIEARVLAGRGSNILEATSYLGWVNLALFLLCIRALRRKSLEGRARRGAYFWGVAVVVFGVLALGPTLQVAGWKSKVPLPYLIVNALPGFSILRAPNRLLILVTLGMGLCSALMLERWFVAGRRKLALGIAFLIVLDLALFPLSRLWQAKPVPPVYAQLAADAEPGAVLEIPSGYHFDSSWHNVRAMYYQTRHGRPLLVGYISRTPEDPYQVLERFPVIRALSYETLTGQLARERIEPARARADLAMLGVRYIVLHPGDVLEVTRGDQEALDAARNLLEEVVGPPLWEDERTATYRFEPTER